MELFLEGQFRLAGQCDVRKIFAAKRVLPVFDRPTTISAASRLDFVPSGFANQMREGGTIVHFVT
jgi:hypothetical protein